MYLLAFICLLVALVFFIGHLVRPSVLGVLGVFALGIGIILQLALTAGPIVTFR